MNQEFTDSQYNLILNLMKVCEHVQVFEYEGVLYEGNKVETIKHFVHNNPTGGDFHVWLQKNHFNDTLMRRNDLNEILNRLED